MVCNYFFAKNTAAANRPAAGGIYRDAKPPEVGVGLFLLEYSSAKRVFDPDSGRLSTRISLKNDMINKYYSICIIAQRFNNAYKLCR